MKPKAVILAAGKGTRLHPVTLEIPKPLLPVNKAPIMNYLVELFYKCNIEEIIVSILSEYRDDFFWWKKRYYPEKNIKLISIKEPLGTWGGIVRMKDELGDSAFFVSNGDEIKELDLSKMLDFHKKQDVMATVALTKVENPQDYGVAVLKGDLIKEFIEKPENPPSSYINSGLYFFEPEILDYRKTLDFSDVEKNIFPYLAKENKLGGFCFEGRWMDCGTWERYEYAIKELKKAKLF